MRTPLTGIGHLRALLLTLICTFASVLSLATPQAAHAATYYVDATGGSDAAAGTSPDEAWQTINRVNTSSFSAGDQILLKRGEIWRESLVVPSSGSSGNPIVFGAYGTGSNPTLYKTNLYTNWWEHSLFTNGSFEVFTGTADDGVADTFPSYSLLPISGDTIEAVSDSQTGNTAISIHKVVENSYGSWFRQQRSVQGATQYYFEYSGKRDTGAYLLMQIRDPNNNLYLQDDLSWSSSNNYVDALAIASTDWTLRSLSFTTDPSTTTLDFRFFNYSGSGNVGTGLGRNYVDDIYLAAGATKPVADVWVGYSAAFVNSWGIIDAGEKRNHHSQTSGIDEFTLANEYSYHKLNSNYFHYRKDGALPTQTEIGARPYGILIADKSFVTVQNIDVYGTGGKIETGSAKSHGLMVTGSSDNIVYQDSSTTYGGHDVYGVHVANTATNVTLRSITAHSNGSTGIYHNGTGSVTQSAAYSNGTLSSDVGDGGGIGSYLSPGLTISYNEVYSNGKTNADADFEISVVGATGPATIHGNYVHNCEQGCIQVSEGGTSSVISYNVVEGYGTSAAAGSSAGKYSGIRIGGGASFSGVANVRVLNNLITQGAAPQSGNVQAGVYARFADTAELVLKNNSFFQNSSPDVYIHSSVTPGDFEINANNYYRATYTAAWHWLGTNYDSLSAWQSASGHDEFALSENPNFLDSPNSNYRLTAGSPLIDAGQDVGLSTDRAQSSVPQGSSPDIGAYEYTPTPSADPPVGASYSTATTRHSARENTTYPRCRDGWAHCIHVSSSPILENGWIYNQRAPGVFVFISAQSTSIDLSLELTSHDAEQFHQLKDSPLFPWSQRLNTASELFEVRAVSSFNGYPVTQTDSPYSLVLPYQPERLGAASPATLRIAQYDPSAQRWTVLKHNTVLNQEAREVANTTTQLGYFAVVY